MPLTMARRVDESIRGFFDIGRAEARRKGVEALKTMEEPGKYKAKQGKLRLNKAKQGEINYWRYR